MCQMELELGLALPTQNLHMQGFDVKKDHCSVCLERQKCIENKCSFEDYSEQSLKRLPLLVWSGQPNEEDERKGKKSRSTCISNKNDEEENEVVGWPPINAWRKKFHHHQAGHLRSFAESVRRLEIIRNGNETI